MQTNNASSGRAHASNPERMNAAGRYPYRRVFSYFTAMSIVAMKIHATRIWSLQLVVQKIYDEQDMHTTVAKKEYRMFSNIVRLISNNMTARMANKKTLVKTIARISGYPSFPVKNGK